jgi:NitT/TauT family transport system substrate-binding protein
MRNKKFLLSVFCALLITAFVLGACTPAPTAAPAEPTQPAVEEPTKAPEPTAVPTVEPTKAPPDKVVFRLSWKWKAEYAAIALADDKGFFAEQNIDVEIMEGAGSGEVIPLVAQKQVDFSNPSLTTTAIGISQGMEVVAIANLMAKNPIALAHFSDVKLEEPKDLEGKRIALAPGEAFAVIYPAFAEKWGIDTTKVKGVNLDAAVKNQQFLDGGIDILPTYLNNEVPALRTKTDKEIDVLLPADWGFNTLAGGVITHKDTIKNNPDLVRRFMAALTKGYEYSNEHPEEAAEAVKARSQELAGQDAAVILEQIKLTMELAFGGDASKSFGWMNEEDWDRTLAPLLEAGTIEKRPENSALFTNDFLYSE